MKLEKIAPILIIITGLIFTFFDSNPINLIRLAQITNGLMLPGITLFILYLCFSAQKNNKNNINFLIRILGLFLLFLFFSFLAFKILFL